LPAGPRGPTLTVTFFFAAIRLRVAAADAETRRVV
jgi:hypothetical protein